MHDYLLVLRGAERTFATMADLWPRAPIHTLLYDERVVRPRFPDRPIIASRLQRCGFGQDGFRRLLPFFPPAVERLPIGAYDLVISSSSAFAHGVIPREGAVHLSYCHSPFRYAWHELERGVREAPVPLRFGVRRVLGHIRAWDRRASSRVTHFVANSRLTQQRIANFYDREALIVHPPVDVDRFRAAVPEEYVLFVGEVVAHKRAEVAIKAALLAGTRMKVVGTGPDLVRLHALYGDRVDFLGRVDDAKLADTMARAAVVIVPNVEEFGITAVEAQAAGRPVLAVNAGGAQETVLDGVTGVLVDDSTPEALAEALRYVSYETFKPSDMISNARRFSPEAFQASISSAIVAAWQDR